MSGSLTGHGKGSIYLTLIVAIILTMVPLPVAIDMFRPDWVALVVLYWVIALPHHLNVVSAWIVGLIMDILLGSTLGIHALSMAVISCVVAAQYQKIRNFSVWQQALVMGSLIFADNC